MMGSSARWRTAVCALGAAALVAVGCGGSEDGGSPSSGGSDSGAQSSGVADSKARVDAATKGSFREPPSEGPAPQKGKRIYAVACSTAAPGCANPAIALRDAGKELGWNVTLVDGKGDPGVYNSSIRQALAAGADGIALFSIDCSAVQAPLKEAKSKDVPVVGVYSFDCDDATVGGDPLFAATLNYGEGHESPAEYFTEWGRLAADYVIAKTDGKAKIVNTAGPAYLTGHYKEKGFVEQIEKNCPGCKIVESVDIKTSGANGPQLAQQKIQTTLQRHPDADVLHMWSDSSALAVSQILRNKQDLLMVGGEGLPENMNLIRDGVQDVSIGAPSEWFGWAAADQFIRLFAGETEMPDQGLGFLIIDKENNLPAGKGESWKPTIDFKSAYKARWSGGA